MNKKKNDDAAQFLKSSRAFIRLGFRIDMSGPMNSQQISPKVTAWIETEQTKEIDFVRVWTKRPMEPRRTRAEEALHAQAQKCQRLASESLDPFVREALIKLASHYEHQAERVEQQRQERER
jgi:hypothetical protein